MLSFKSSRSPSSQRAVFALPALLGLALAASCSGGSGGDDGPVVNLTDATPAPVDADVRVFDAAPCNGTVCDGVCVDTSSDPLNCGGCGDTCQSPGQICTGSTPCACPADFVPMQIGGGGFDQVQEQAPVFIAIAAGFASTLDVTAVVYDLTLDLNVEYDLAEGLGTLSAPAVAAGYDVDINSFTAHTAYGATAGTITFTQICAEGASGTMSNVVFSEVAGVTDPTAIADGCTMSYESLTFSIGTCPQP